MGALAHAENLPPAGQVFSAETGVGIGTASPASVLDASRGEVRVGDSGAPCSVRNQGAIRYAKDNGRLQFCDGKDWRWLAIDGGP